MVEQVIERLRDTFPPELVAFIVSLLPILELRGGLVAAKILGVAWPVAFPVCVLGNMLPIPFLLIFLKKIFCFIRRHSKRLSAVVEKLEERASKKGEKVKKYRTFGLFVLVAIPLPGTGAWTGALVAETLGTSPRKAFFTIFLGVIAAGLIMSVLSYLIPGLFF